MLVLPSLLLSGDEIRIMDSIDGGNEGIGAIQSKKKRATKKKETENESQLEKGERGCITRTKTAARPTAGEAGTVTKPGTLVKIQTTTNADRKLHRSSKMFGHEIHE